VVGSRGASRFAAGLTLKNKSGKRRETETEHFKQASEKEKACEVEEWRRKVGSCLRGRKGAWLVMTQRTPKKEEDSGGSHGRVRRALKPNGGTRRRRFAKHLLQGRRTIESERRGMREDRRKEEQRWKQVVHVGKKRSKGPEY